MVFKRKPENLEEALPPIIRRKDNEMNTAYWMAIVWGLLAVIAILFTKGPQNHVVIALLTAASILASLLGVAISYNLL